MYYGQLKGLYSCTNCNSSQLNSFIDSMTTPLLLFSAYAIPINSYSYNYNNTGFCNSFQKPIQYLEFNQTDKLTYKFPCVVADSIAVNNLISNSFGFDFSPSWNRGNNP
jgi:hypothetical protein